MIFLDTINNVLGKMRQEPVTALPTDTTTDAYRVQIAVQRAVNRIWNHKTWAFKRQSDTLALTSGESDYVCPRSVGEIYSVTLNQDPWTIKPIAKHRFNSRFINPTETGNPRISILSDFQGVENQPAASGQLSVVSASALDVSTSDTDTYRVFIEGISTGGVTEFENVGLNGTTAVTTAAAFTSIKAITRSGVTNGRTIITADSGATSVLTLAKNELGVRLKKLSFYPIPASSLTATINHFSLPPILKFRFQDLIIPDRWDYVVEQWAFALALQSKGQEQATEQTSATSLAIKMLEEDMSSEEIVSVEEPIESPKVGGDGIVSGIPSGFGYVER
jgi:hypothetical protein